MYGLAELETTNKSGGRRTGEIDLPHFADTSAAIGVLLLAGRTKYHREEAQDSANLEWFTCFD